MKKNAKTKELQQDKLYNNNNSALEHSVVKEISTIHNPSSFTSKTEEFYAALKMAKNSKVLIVIKGYPDPDSIACALTFQYIALHYAIESTILHFDEVSHPENKALIKKLSIELVRYTKEFDFSPYKYLVFNDTQTTDLNIDISPTIKNLVLVDHHKNLGAKDCIFTDIREDAGSTSAIYTEYLIQGPVNLESGNTDTVKLATALMHGIRSDTNSFLNAQDIDFLGAAYLSQITDKELLSIISHQSVSTKTMDMTQIALQNKDIKGTYLFAGVGFVREDDRDGIGQVADYLLLRDGIDTVIIYGIVGGKYIDGSLRTTSHTLDPDKWIKDLFGFSEDGKPFGGGRRDKGGFQLPLGVLARCSDKDLLWKVTKHTIEEIFYNKIGIKTKDTSSSLS